MTGVQTCALPIYYASEDTRKIGEKLIEKELLKNPNEKVRKIAAQHIAEIENGSRDFRF